MNLTQEKPKKDPQDAAATIQRAWRRYTQIKVFRKFKRIIMCCMDQNPRTVFKTVNPREAELLDEAAGIFIKFRFAGNNFPPHIYYKIFTYLPIVDICAGFPREHVQLRHRIPAAQLESCWYQRVENNSWRLYLGRVANRDGPEEIGLDKKMDFHYSKLQRKWDVIRWRKRRKIEWWKQIYDKGRLQADPEHRDTATIVDSLGQNQVEITEEDQDDECEVAELRSWASALEFDKYDRDCLQADPEHRDTATIVDSSGQNQVELTEEEQDDEREVDELRSWANALNFDKYINEWKQLTHCHY